MAKGKRKTTADKAKRAQEGDGPSDSMDAMGDAAKGLASGTMKFMWAQKGDEDDPAAAPSSNGHHTANSDPSARLGRAPAGAASGPPSVTGKLPDLVGTVPYSRSDAVAPSPATASLGAAAGGGGLAAMLARNGNDSAATTPQQGHTNEAGMMLLSMLTGGAAATPPTSNPDPNLRPADAFSHAWSTTRPTLAVGVTHMSAPQQQLGGATTVGSSSAAAPSVGQAVPVPVPVAKAAAMRTLDERFDAAQYEFFAAGAAGETLEVSTSAAIEEGEVPEVDVERELLGFDFAAERELAAVGADEADDEFDSMLTLSSTIHQLLDDTDAAAPTPAPGGGGGGRSGAAGLGLWAAQPTTITMGAMGTMGTMGAQRPFEDLSVMAPQRPTGAPPQMQRSWFGASTDVAPSESPEAMLEAWRAKKVTEDVAAAAAMAAGRGGGMSGGLVEPSGERRAVVAAAVANGAPLHEEAASPAVEAVSKSDKRKNRTKRKSASLAPAVDGGGIGDAVPRDHSPPEGAAGARDGETAAAVAGEGAGGDGECGATANGTAANNGTAEANGATTAVNFLSGVEFLEHAARAWGLGEVHAGPTGETRLGGIRLLSPHAVVRSSLGHAGMNTSPPPPRFNPKVAEAQARAILAALQGGSVDSHVMDGALSARPLPSGAKAVGLLEGDAASSSPAEEEGGSVGYPADWATWAATVPDPRLSQQQSFQSEVKALEEIDIKAVLKTLSRMLPTDARVLEVGSTTAFVAVRLARLLPQGVVYTADPHPDWVDYLRSRAEMERLPNLRPLCCDTTDLVAALPETLNLVVMRAEAAELPVALRALRAKLRGGSHVAVLETSRSRAKKLAKEALAAGFSQVTNKLHHKVVLLALAPLMQ